MNVKIVVGKQTTGVWIYCGDNVVTFLFMFVYSWSPCLGLTKLPWSLSNGKYGEDFVLSIPKTTTTDCKFGLKWGALAELCFLIMRDIWCSEAVTLLCYRSFSHKAPPLPLSNWEVRTTNMKWFSNLAKLTISSRHRIEKPSRLFHLWNRIYRGENNWDKELKSSKTSVCF